MLTSPQKNRHPLAGVYANLDYCCMKWTNQIASLEVTIRDSYPLLRVASHSKCHAQLRACARAVV